MVHPGSLGARRPPPQGGGQGRDGGGTAAHPGQEDQAGGQQELDPARRNTTVVADKNPTWTVVGSYFFSVTIFYLFHSSHLPPPLPLCCFQLCARL